MSIAVGLSIRNMGDESSPSLMLHCTQAAEDAGLHSVWITDHIAIPPDDAEGSGGRYTDPLATIAWLGGQTERVLLGTGVLVLPYRPALPTAKWVATVQELIGERLLLGVGIGWMKAEFDAVGVPLRRRSSVADATLAFIDTCFDNEVVESNGQELIFKPRPRKPPILIGGRAPHAIERALRYGDGWLPMGADPERLGPIVRDYRAEARRHGRQSLVYAFGSLPVDRAACQERLRALEDAGVDCVVAGFRYTDAAGFDRNLAELVAAIR